MKKGRDRQKYGRTDARHYAYRVRTSLITQRMLNQHFMDSSVTNGNILVI